MLRPYSCCYQVLMDTCFARLDPTDTCLLPAFHRQQTADAEAEAHCFESKALPGTQIMFMTALQKN
jgi:hypothetical protein